MLHLLVDVLHEELIFHSITTGASNDIDAGYQDCPRHDFTLCMSDEFDTGCDGKYEQSVSGW